MNKKEMIEEMASDMDFACVELSKEQRIEIARTLINLGYRKTEPIKLTTIGYGKEHGCYYADIIATGQELAQRVYFQASYFEREEIQEETAKEIYSKLIELSENPCNSQEEIYKAVFEPYGVNVEE